MRRIAPLFALALLSAPAALRAQSDAPLGVGTRVRITAPTVLNRKLAGEGVRMTADTLVLARRDEDVAVPLDAVERIEMSRGKDRFTGMLWGAGIGAASGAAIGAISCEVIGEDCTYVEAGSLLVGAMAGIAGAGVGAVAGFAIGDERWTTIRESTGSPFALSAAPAPRGGVAVGVSVRF